MLLGITENLQENKRIATRKKIAITTSVFLVCLFLPFIIYGLFYFDVVSGKPAFSKDIQEPVAKVVTNTGVGTAFLVSPTTLLTARHVVENNKPGDEVDIVFEQSKTGLKVRGKIKYICPSTTTPGASTVSLEYFCSDVAVIEVPEVNDIEPLVLGESDAVNNLDNVILIGYPNGDYSITPGSINSDKYQGLNLFKLDAAANPGNSGGPCILREDNTVIGILVGTDANATQGSNVALKINDVRKILQQANVKL